MEDKQYSPCKWNPVSSEYNGKNVQFGSEGGVCVGVHTHGFDCRLKNGINNGMAIVALAGGLYSCNARDLLGKPGNAADLLQKQCEAAEEYAAGKMGRDIGIGEAHLKIDLQYAIMETLKWMVELQDMVIGVQKNGAWVCADGCSDDEDSDDEDSYEGGYVDRRHLLLSTVMNVLDYHNRDEGEDYNGIKFPKATDVVPAVLEGGKLFIENTPELELIADECFDVKVCVVCKDYVAKIKQRHHNMMEFSCPEVTNSNGPFKDMWQLGGNKGESTEGCGLPSCNMM